MLIDMTVVLKLSYLTWLFCNETMTVFSMFNMDLINTLNAAVIGPCCCIRIFQLEKPCLRTYCDF